MRQNQQNKQRMRGRQNRKVPNPLTRSFDSNGPDIKIRGTALHIAEKYTQLARDASSSGDRVMAENYLQHAEHYYRIIASAQAAQTAAALGREDEETDDDFEPMGSDRFEPRQIEIKTPGQFEGNRQPSEVRPEREGGYQPREPREQGDRPERGERNERYQQDRNNGDRGERNNTNGDRSNGDRNNGDRNNGERQDNRDYRRDGRRQRFDRFGRDRDRGDRNGQPDQRPERQDRPERAAPMIQPSFADAPQPDVSFPDVPQPVLVKDRPVVHVASTTPHVPAPAVAPAPAPAPVAEAAPAPAPVREAAPEAASAEGEGAGERKRTPRRRATTVGVSPDADVVPPRPRAARRPRVSAEKAPSDE
ncbi:DUF4167 domain-containing protein [Oryzibacter oryziterrae]|uniref:DUF4167 domain-containing protein n=1 Tax=Oryzibacter oryziterrae TaxID=2766474 RepID=UPI001F29CDAC|nr:DUF4167 domain-containing protein [Oryzibacter oryziterrae]